MREINGASPIVRLDDDERFGINVVRINGLQIFSANEVVIPYAKDPRLIFLRHITETLPCAAQLGWLALKDIIDTPEEAFGASSPSNEYVLTRISLHGGTFYELSEGSALLFPLVNVPFWQSSETLLEAIEYCLCCDALAIYAGAGAGAREMLTIKANDPFAGQEQWIKEATSLYSLVIISQYDGWDFEIYAKDGDSYSALNEPLANAVSSIKTSSWYQKHKTELKWDEDPDNCLKLAP